MQNAGPVPSHLLPLLHYVDGVQEDRLFSDCLMPHYVEAGARNLTFWLG